MGAGIVAKVSSTMMMYGGKKRHGPKKIMYEGPWAAMEDRAQAGTRLQSFFKGSPWTIASRLVGGQVRGRVGGSTIPGAGRGATRPGRNGPSACRLADRGRRRGAGAEKSMFRSGSPVSLLDAGPTTAGRAVQEGAKDTHKNGGRANKGVFAHYIAW